MINSEELKFEAKERELKIEIERNPVKDCISCKCWQHAGEMASCMHLCDDCGARNSRSNISRIINNYATKSNITYDIAWDLAYKHLKFKQDESASKGSIYFDEDHFEYDLVEYFNQNTSNHNTQEKKKSSIFKRIFGI